MPVDELHSLYIYTLYSRLSVAVILIHVFLLTKQHCPPCFNYILKIPYYCPSEISPHKEANMAFLRKNKAMDLNRLIVISDADPNPTRPASFAKLSLTEKSELCIHIHFMRIRIQQFF